MRDFSHNALLARLLCVAWVVCTCIACTELVSCRSSSTSGADGAGRPPEGDNSPPGRGAAAGPGTGSGAVAAEPEAEPIPIFCPWEHPGAARPSETVILISTVYAGASPREVEWSVTRAIAEQTSSLPRVERVRAVSREGGALVLLSFPGGADLWSALDRARQRVAEADTYFPEAAERPMIRAVFRDPRRLWVVSADTLSVPELTEIAESAARALLAVPGVGTAEVVGGAYPEIEVRLDPDRLAAYQVTAADVAAAIEAANVDLPMLARPGLDEVVVRGATQVDREALEAVTVAFIDGRPVRVGDVAQVGRSVERDGITWSWLDGRLAVTIEVTSIADRPPDAAALDAAAAELRASAPAGLQLERLDWTQGSRVRIELEASGEPSADRDVLRRLANEVGEVSEVEHVLARLGADSPSVRWLGGASFEAGAAVVDLWLAPAADPGAVMAVLSRLTGGAELGARVAWPGRRLVLAVEAEPREEGADEAIASLPRRLQAVPGVLVTQLRSRTVDQIDLRTDREALARYGLSAREVAQEVALAFRGVELGRTTGGEPIRLIAGDPTEAPRLDDLTLQVRGPDGEIATIPLSEVVTIERSAQPVARYLLNGRSVFLVDVDVSPTAPATTCDGVARAAGAFAADSGRFVGFWGTE